MFLASQDQKSHFSIHNLEWAEVEKNTEWKGLHDGVHNSSSVFYYFYSTMANTVVNGIHVKGMI